MRGFLFRWMAPQRGAQVRRRRRSLERIGEPALVERLEERLMLDAAPLASAAPSGIETADLQADAAAETQNIGVQQVENGILVSGPGPGLGPLVRVFDSETGALRAELFAYDVGFTGGVRVATGDINADGVPDVITAPGPGGGPHIRAFNGINGALMGEFFAYDPFFFGGVHVASADVNADGFADIITGPGAGSSPLVRVFSGFNGALIDEFLAYDSQFTGGVHVAAGFVNNDAFAEVITGPGPGGGPHVVVFNGFDGAVIGDFFAYGPFFRGGVFVASGDVNGDGFWDVITGAGPGGGPHVRVFSGFDGALIGGFFAYGRFFRGGVRVGAVNANGDIFADIVTGAGPDGGPHLKVFDGDTGAVLSSFFPYPRGFRGGVYVAGSLIAPIIAPASLAQTSEPVTQTTESARAAAGPVRLQAPSADLVPVSNDDLDGIFAGEGLSDRLLGGTLVPEL